MFDLIGDLGGVLEIFVVVFLFIVSPITEYSFKMKAIQKFYLARVKDRNDIFLEGKERTNKRPVPPEFANSVEAIES